MAKNYDWNDDFDNNDWDYKPAKPQKPTPPQNKTTTKPNPRLRKCRACGKLIAKEAKRCPQCGAKKPLLERPIFWIIIGIIWIFFVFPSLFRSSTKKEQPKKIEPEITKEIPTQEPKAEQISESITESESKTEQKELFYIGETAEMNDVQVTCNGYFESNGNGSYATPKDGNVFLYAEIDIANNSNNDIAISSLLSFECYADDYIMDYSFDALMNDDMYRQMDGTIEAGKKMKGLVGYEVPADWNTIEIHFKDNVWKNNKFKFIINRSDTPMN